MLRVSWFGYSHQNDIWNRSTSLPGEAVRKYSRKRSIETPDLTPSGVYFCKDTGRQVMIKRAMLAQARMGRRKRGQKPIGFTSG